MLAMCIWSYDSHIQIYVYIHICVHIYIYICTYICTGTLYSFYLSFSYLSLLLSYAIVECGSPIRPAGHWATIFSTSVVFCASLDYGVTPQHSAKQNKTYMHMYIYIYMNICIYIHISYTFLFLYLYVYIVRESEKEICASKRL